MLHIVNKSPFERNALASCLAHITAADASSSAVLLIEDAVVGAIDGAALPMVAEALSKGVAIYALAPDLQARGLANGNIMKGIKTVDYAGFVDLVTGNDNTQTWL